MTGSGMDEKRKKPGVAFWVAAVLAYPLSIGPACWISSRLNSGAGSVPVVYRPILRMVFPDPWVTRNNKAQVLVLMTNSDIAPAGTQSFGFRH
jgi:hypothetical protein